MTELDVLLEVPESLSRLKNLRELFLTRYRPDNRIPFHIPKSLIPFLKKVEKLNLSYDIMENVDL